MAISPDGRMLYVVSQADRTVTPITTATSTAGTPIRVGQNPVDIAVTPGGRKVYVVNYGDGNAGGGSLTPIRAATGTAGKPVKVFGRLNHPVAIIIKP